MSPSYPTQPNSAIQRLVQQADQAWEQQDYRKSISLIEKATRKEPHNPSLLLHLALAYGRRYDYPAAERCIEKAVQISAQRAQTLGEAGQVCLDFANPEMALRYYLRASRKEGVSIGALMNLVDVYFRDNRIDEGAEILSRAAQIDAKDTRVLLQEAALTRLRGNIPAAESLLRQLVSNPSSPNSVRVRALYDLAAVLDTTGGYDEAMNALLQAKAILRAQAGPFAATLQHMQSRAKEMEQSITTGVLDHWRADLEQLGPPRRITLLCGHPRSGTTLLEQVLDSHSDIISAEETKMMHDDAYLPLIRDFPEGTSILKALDSVPLSVIRRARENYFRCLELFLRCQIGSKLLVDKNPSLNLMIPIVVRVFPEAKFLIALRDPRDTIVSCFMLAAPLTPISSAYLSLEGTVNQYANVMGFWQEMMPRMAERWMHVRYEELIQDLPAVARSVLGFLGVGFEENVLKFYEHAQVRRVQSPSHADVRKPLYRTAVGRWRNYQRYLEPYLPALEPFLKSFNYS